MRSNQLYPMNPNLSDESSYIRTRSQTAPIIAMLFLTAVFASGCIVHDRHGRAHIVSPVLVQPQVVVAPSVAVVTPAPIVFSFTNHHRSSVRTYYHDHPRHHGKRHKWKRRGRGHLPPGLRKRDHLPPGIRMQVLPGDLIRRLPHPPHGTRYTYHNDQVLLINLKTRVVLDLIDIEVGF